MITFAGINKAINWRVLVVGLLGVVLGVGGVGAVTPMVAAGYNHTVGLKTDGTVVATGNNDYGQCNVGSWSGIVAITAGWAYTVGLKSDGTVVIVGDTSVVRIDVGSWRGIVSVSASTSYRHLVGLKSDGTVVATGDNSEGQCNVSSWSGIVAVAAGGSFTVGLKSDGTVVFTNARVLGQCDVSSWNGIVAIAAGYNHIVGLKSDGTVLSTGSLIGGGNVSSWSEIVAVAAGNQYTVGLKSDGTVVAVGSNLDWKCNVSSWSGIVAIASGFTYTIGLKFDGTVIGVGVIGQKVGGEGGLCDTYFWKGISAIADGGAHTVGLKFDKMVVATGNNDSGQCNVNTWNGIVAIAAGGGHTVGLKSDGTCIAVGVNSKGQCNVNSWKGIKAVAAKSSNTVGLKSDGTVVVVGDNTYGQCNTSAWNGIIAIAEGEAHTVGLKSDGTVLAVGGNYRGQCNVSSWSGIIAVAAGGDHTVGLKSDGTVVAVGFNNCGECSVDQWKGIVAISANYELTVGLRSDSTVMKAGLIFPGPCNIGSWSGIVAVSAGGGHVVGLNSDGMVIGAGYNEGRVFIFPDWDLGHIQPGPNLIIPSNQTILTPPNLTCTWSRSPSPTPTYTLQVSNASNFSSFVINQSGLSDTTVTLPVLKDSLQYFWRLNSTSSGSTSAWSSVGTFYTTGYFNKPITTAFTASPVQGVTPLAVVFTDQSTGNTTSWQWDFGDGTISTAKNPTHTYTSKGVYNVKLKVSNPVNSDSLIKTGFITVYASAQAAFSASPSQGKDSLTVTFTDQSTGDISTWSWNFGDASTSSTRNPVHKYNSPGNYTVSLTVSGDGGSNTKTVTNCVTVRDTVTAEFSCNKVCGAAPLQVSFNDLSQGDASKWLWHFGDGDSSSLQNPVHTYKSPGLYTVSLNVTGQFGSTSSTVKQGAVNVTGQTIEMKVQDVTIKRDSALTEQVQVTNHSGSSKTVSLSILNPHPQLSLTFSGSSSITLSSGQSLNVPVEINAGATASGVYKDISIRASMPDSTSSYVTTTVSVINPDESLRPELSVYSDDIQLTGHDPGVSATFDITIRNKGLGDASQVPVYFYDYGEYLDSINLNHIAADVDTTFSIVLPVTAPGEHLIRVLIDPDRSIGETDTTNNEAVRLVNLGDSVSNAANLLVNGSLPSSVYTGDLFKISGNAVYEMLIGNTISTDYGVMGGEVRIEIKDTLGNDWDYGGIKTSSEGCFSRQLQAPPFPGIYRVLLTVTDNTFFGTQELTLTVVKKPSGPVEPPAPPVHCIPGYSGQGEWQYSNADSSWQWKWLVPPVNDTPPVKDMRITSDNIHFSKLHPSINEPINITAEFDYWAVSTDSLAQNVPLSIRVTDPDGEKKTIFSTNIDQISMAAPDFGKKLVYAGWTGRADGIHIVEATIDSDYVEDNVQNNTSTRALIVGKIPNLTGVLAGHIQGEDGAINGVTVQATNSSGQSQNVQTNNNGFYVFGNMSQGHYTVSCSVPAGYSSDTSSRAVDVVDQQVTSADFSLNRNSPPVPKVNTLPALTIGCCETIGTIPTAIDRNLNIIQGTTASLSFSSTGSRTITWSYVDGKGQSTTQQQTVIVIDTTAPVPDTPALPSINGSAPFSVATAPTATDKCSGQITGTTTDPITYSTPGVYTINWIYTDNNGNKSSQPQTVNIYREYTFTINSDGNGTVAPEGALKVRVGDTVKVRAAGNSGYLFESWNVTAGSATILSVQAESTFVIAGASDATISAHFIKPGSVVISGIGSGAHVYSNATSGWIGKQVMTGPGTLGNIKPGAVILAIGDEGKRTEYVSAQVVEGQKTVDTVNLHDAAPLVFGRGKIFEISGFAFTIGNDASVACDDLDCDGDRDLAILRKNGTVELYENKGTSLSLKKILSLGVTDAKCLRIADWDGDGFPDLLVASSANGIIRIPGCGSFCFADTQIMLKPGECAGFSIFDYNRFTKPEFAIGKTDGTFVLDTAKDGMSGSFQIKECNGRVVDAGVNAEPLFIDLNGDGIDDLVMVDSSGTLVWYRNNLPDNTCFSAMGPVNVDGAPLRCALPGHLSLMYGDKGELPGIFYTDTSGVLQYLTAQLRGDLDSDGVVGLADYMKFINAWDLKEGDRLWVTSANMALNSGVQKIDFADFLLFVNSWGKSK
jgi:PKD repeat protein/alpha-tubulin suppressor-like RCC1 family protein